MARAPLRISLGGGGTDLPSWYRRHGGFTCSAAIDRHVWVLAGTSFQERFRLKHLAWEEVDDPGDVAHPILNAALTHHWDGRPLELASMSDVPPGTGLGSSGAYAVATLKALRLAAGADAEPGELAEAASRLEIDVLGWSVGKQDQYAAALGGLNAFTFNADDTVEVRPLDVPPVVQEALRERFLLFYAGGSRSASQLLGHSVERVNAGDQRMAGTLERIAAAARETAAALEAGEMTRVAELMNAGWELKAERSPDTLSERICELRDLALDAGAGGVSLMGAGGAGFLLVYAENAAATRAAMQEAGAPELAFDLERRGCTGLG